jgi:hypothetical protein
MKLVLSLLFSILITAHAQATSTFGNYGQGGRDGSDGASGADGKNITLVADGTPVFYDLRGRAGANGKDGTDGEDAYLCSQGEPSYDLRGASGGDGGNAGKGGAGGDGGDTLIFYQDIKNLSAIKIFNAGAAGGTPGKPGRGGGGCRCTNYSWDVESCRTDEEGDRVCSETRYTCSNGSDGRDGSDARSGEHGSRGRITLVKDLTQLPVEVPRVNTTLGKAAIQITAMSKRIYEQKSGAVALFAEGSNISDTYYEYVRLAHKEIQIVWSVERELALFEDIEVSYSFDGKNIHVTLGDGILFKSHYVRGEKRDQFVITQAFFPLDLKHLELSQPTGREEELSIEITDHMGLNLIVQNKFTVELKFKRWLGYYETEFYGTLKPEDFVMTENKIIIPLGKLKDVRAKKFKKKRKISVEIDITRTYEGRSVSKNLKLGEFKIP